MSKRSEEAAIKSYPVKGEWVGNQYGEWDADINRFPRTIYKEGYEQAEKEIKDTLLRLVEEEVKFWDDGEMIFRRLKNEIEAL